MTNSSKSMKIDPESDSLLEVGKRRTGIPKAELLAKSVRYFVPRVLKGEISTIEPDEVQVEAANATGESRS